MDRCINCGIASRCNTVKRRRIHESSILSVIRQWLAPLTVNDSDFICPRCWDLARSSPINGSRQLGHLKICLRCGRSIASRFIHVLDTRSPRELKIYNVMQEWIKPRKISNMQREICHACWVAADRAAVHMTLGHSTSHQRDAPQEVNPEVQDLPVELPDQQIGSNLQEPLQPQVQDLPTEFTIANNEQEPSIVLPEFIEMERRCFIEGCQRTERFVFVCVQCNVRVCGACDAQGRHALHYVLRAPSGRSEEELKMVLSRVYEAISLAGLSTPEQPAEHTEGQQDDGGIELKTEIKLEVDIEDKDPFGGPEYEEPFLSTTVQAGGSQVVPEQIEIKSEPSEPDTSATHKETDFYVNSAESTSRRRSVTSFRSTLDSDDSQPLAKRRHISSDTESKYETFPTHTPKKQTTIPDERKSTTDPNADPGSPSVAASPSRIKEV